MVFSGKAILPVKMTEENTISSQSESFLNSVLQKVSCKWIPVYTWSPKRKQKAMHGHHNQVIVICNFCTEISYMNLILKWIISRSDALRKCYCSIVHGKCWNHMHNHTYLFIFRPFILFCLHVWVFLSSFKFFKALSAFFSFFFSPCYCYWFYIKPYSLMYYKIYLLMVNWGYNLFKQITASSF